MTLQDYSHTVTDKLVLFYGGPFSQWAESPFKIDGMEFNCAEQYMMFQKASFFCNQDLAQKIMETDYPRKQKAYGRKVRDFNMAQWSKVAKGIVYKGSWAKYSQNNTFKQVLLDTGSRIIVEASPYDKVWGIGLSEDDPRALDHKQWQGTNWLGQVLIDVREAFLVESEAFESSPH